MKSILTSLPLCAAALFLSACSSDNAKSENPPQNTASSFLGNSSSSESMASIDGSSSVATSTAVSSLIMTSSAIVTTSSSIVTNSSLNSSALSESSSSTVAIGTSSRSSIAIGDPITPPSGSNGQLKQNPALIEAILASSVTDQSRTYNPEGVIPPQCYTKTEGKFNPCYTCHQFYPRGEGRANRLDDGELQGDYGFSDIGITNHWLNLFEDRTARIAQMSDESIATYIDQDNYSDLAGRLLEGGWSAWYPDLKDLQLAAGAFDEQGFAKDGSQWVAFNYSPLPSTFWPTNGSTDDVMIRLPEAFRQNSKGEYDRNIYILNLSAVEAAIKGYNTLSIPPMDEVALGFDIDGDDTLGMASVMKRPAQYFGMASDQKVWTFLYPLHTEFLHSVRYIGVDEDGEIYTPKRMKELRYMVKNVLHRKSMLGNFYAEEQRDKFEGNLPRYSPQGDKGLDNKFGWNIIGFIEARDGSLRQQTYEENLFCMGCHTTLGATIDQTFSFVRKVDGAKGWGYINLKSMPDVPTYGETEGSILTYLERVGGGNEFRANEELQGEYFVDGVLDKEKVKKAKDTYELITPSAERAYALNKAYKTIVDDQDYIYGRDANITPLENVFQEVDTDVEPLEAKFRKNSDMRLDWSSFQ